MRKWVNEHISDASIWLIVWENTLIYLLLLGAKAASSSSRIWSRMRKRRNKSALFTQQVAHVVVQNTRPPPRSCISVRFSPLLILLFKEPFSSLSDSRREATHSSLSWCGIRMRDLLEIATLNAQCHRASWYSICTCASCWRQPNSEFGGLLYPFFCFLKLSSLSLSGAFNSVGSYKYYILSKSLSNRTMYKSQNVTEYTGLCRGPWWSAFLH